MAEVNEDGLVMWANDVETTAYGAKLDALLAAAHGASRSEAMRLGTTGSAASDERGIGWQLGIETSCDETALRGLSRRAGRSQRSSIVSSQIALHERYGGVVPELAGRAHVERIIPVVTEALERAGLDASGREPNGGGRLSAVAATVGPGLVGALLVGISAAKSLALGWQLPFIGVNHLEGHLYAAMLEDPTIELPAIVLLVSGGHTLLIEMRAPGDYEVLGATLDDAAGEAFDKVARFLGLGYPGGPGVERAAARGDSAAIAFPRPMSGVGLSFSFSGLKTAVVHYVRAHEEVATDDVAASFQAAVVDVLVDKAMAAATLRGARAICLAGGVAANGPLKTPGVARGGRGRRSAGITSQPCDVSRQRGDDRRGRRCPPRHRWPHRARRRCGARPRISWPRGARADAKLGICRRRCLPATPSSGCRVGTPQHVRSANHRSA